MKQIVILLPDEDLVSIKTAAQKARMPLSTFVRHVLVQSVIVPHEAAEEKARAKAEAAEAAEEKARAKAEAAEEKARAGSKPTKSELAAQRRACKKRLSAMGDAVDDLTDRIQGMVSRGMVERGDKDYTDRFAVRQRATELWEAADAACETAPIEELDRLICELEAYKPAMLEAGKDPPLIRSNDPISDPMKRKLGLLPKPKSEPPPLPEYVPTLADMVEVREQFQFYKPPGWQAKVADLDKRIAAMQETH